MFQPELFTTETHFEIWEPSSKTGSASGFEGDKTEEFQPVSEGTPSLIVSFDLYQGDDLILSRERDDFDSKRPLDIGFQVERDTDLLVKCTNGNGIWIFDRSWEFSRQRLIVSEQHVLINGAIFPAWNVQHNPDDFFLFTFQEWASRDDVEEPAVEYWRIAPDGRIFELNEWPVLQSQEQTKRDTLA